MSIGSAALGRRRPEDRRNGGPDGGQVTGSGPGGRITRDDLASKLRSISGQAAPQVEISRSAGAWAVAAAVGIGIVGAYLWGRHRGKRTRALIEIRRV